MGRALELNRLLNAKNPLAGSFDTPGYFNPLFLRQAAVIIADEPADRMFMGNEKAVPDFQFMPWVFSRFPIWGVRRKGNLFIYFHKHV